MTETQFFMNFSPFIPVFAIWVEPGIGNESTEEKILTFLKRSPLGYSFRFLCLHSHQPDFKPSDVLSIIHQSMTSFNTLSYIHDFTKTDGFTYTPDDFRDNIPWIQELNAIFDVNAHINQSIFYNFPLVYLKIGLSHDSFNKDLIPEAPLPELSSLTFSLLVNNDIVVSKSAGPFVKDHPQIAGIPIHKNDSLSSDFQNFLILYLTENLSDLSSLLPILIKNLKAGKKKQFDQKRHDFLKLRQCMYSIYLNKYAAARTPLKSFSNKTYPSFLYLHLISFNFEKNWDEFPTLFNSLINPETQSFELLRFFYQLISYLIKSGAPYETLFPLLSLQLDFKSDYLVCFTLLKAIGFEFLAQRYMKSSPDVQRIPLLLLYHASQNYIGFSGHVIRSLTFILHLLHSGNELSDFMTSSWQSLSIKTLQDIAQYIPESELRFQIFYNSLIYYAANRDIPNVESSLAYLQQFTGNVIIDNFPLINVTTKPTFIPYGSPQQSGYKREPF